MRPSENPAGQPRTDDGARKVFAAGAAADAPRRRRANSGIRDGRRREPPARRSAIPGQPYRLEPPADPTLTEQPFERRIRLLDALPFATIHLLCLGVFWVGWSWIAILVALACAGLRMFVITAFYHRYFSHRTFRVRARHAVRSFAVRSATTAAQRGPLWWAATPPPPPPPLRPSRVRRALAARSTASMVEPHVAGSRPAENFYHRLQAAIPDLAKYPELRWLDRFDTIVGPWFLGASMFALGTGLATLAPALGTNGPQFVRVGLRRSRRSCCSTTPRARSTRSRTPWGHATVRDRATRAATASWLALAHARRGLAQQPPPLPRRRSRQGFRWWEIDLAYAALYVMRRLGLAWDFRPVPAHILDRREPSHPVPAAMCAWRHGLLKIAIVGTGISGLVVCAHRAPPGAHDDYGVRSQRLRLGGHTAHRRPSSRTAQSLRGRHRVHRLQSTATYPELHRSCMERARRRVAGVRR